MVERVSGHRRQEPTNYTLEGDPGQLGGSSGRRAVCDRFRPPRFTDKSLCLRSMIECWTIAPGEEEQACRVYSGGSKSSWRALVFS